MLISNEKSRSSGEERPVNTNSSSASFFQFDKDYRLGEYDKSNKALPSTQISPSYPVNNVSQNFPSHEHLICQHCNKACKTETGLSRHKAKCKERDKPSDNNEHNISSTSNDTIYYQLPKQSNSLGCKRGIPSRQTLST